MHHYYHEDQLCAGNTSTYWKEMMAFKGATVTVEEFSEVTQELRNRKDGRMGSF